MPLPLGKGQLKLRRRSFGSAFFACHEVLREAGIPKRIEAPYVLTRELHWVREAFAFWAGSLVALEGGPHLA